MTDISKYTNQENWQTKYLTITAKNGHLLDTNEWSDVIFTVGEEPDIKEFKAHKLILSISSPVFCAMFRSDLTSKDECISITDIDPPIFELLLRFAYTDSVHLNNVDVTFQLYYAAKKYMLPGLTKTCVEYLMTNMPLRRALDVYDFAKFHGEEMLSDAAMFKACERNELDERMKSTGCSYCLWPCDTNLSRRFFIKSFRNPGGSLDCGFEGIGLF